MLLPDQPSPIGGGSFSPSSKNQRSSRRDRSQTAERTTKASKTSRLVNRFRRGGSSTGSSVHSTSSNEDLRHDAGMTSNPKHDRRHDHLSPLAHSILVEQQKAAAELSSRGNEEGNVSGTLSAAGTGSQVNLIHQARSVESTIRSPSTDSTTVTDQIAGQNRMHQSSSRLLRMTDDERPFTRVSRTSETSGEAYMVP